MAKKATTAKKKTTRTKKESKEPKKAVEYSEFIKTHLFRMITENLPRITEICKQYEGIEPMGLEEWKYFDNLIIEISKIRQEYEHDSYGTHIRLEPIKRQQYTITQKVREMERKRFILDIASRIKDDNPEMNIHYCNLIFLHIAIMLEENGKKKEVKKEIEK